MDKNEQKVESMRQLVEWAINAGRVLQSDQTGLIHFNYANPSGLVHHTIPVWENCLFALALLRSRTMENIKEAQTILTRLFSFQINSGNFPVYLTDFPHCRDFLAAVHLITPIYQILKGFRHVLGPELRAQTMSVLEQVIQYGWNACETQLFPYSIAVRFGAGLVACGRLKDRADWLEKGSSLLIRLGTKAPDHCLYATKSLADLLIAFQLLEDDPSTSDWKSTWDFICHTWNRELGCYCGPSVKEMFNLGAPVTNLYELYLSALCGQFSERMKQSTIAHLSGALIYPFHSKEELFKTKSYIHGDYEGQSWLTIVEERWALSLVDKRNKIAENREKLFTPMKLFWGSSSELNSFVCQNAMNDVTYEFGEAGTNQGALFFDLNRPFEPDGLEKSREVSFFVNFQTNLQVRVEEKQATTFKLGESIKIHLSDNKKIGLKFELVNGEGDFSGHVSMCNRPSQVNLGESKKFEVNDWTIFLKTLRRSEKCLIKVSFNFDFVV